MPDDFPFGDEPDEDTPDLGDNPNFKQLRNYAKKLERERKELQTTVQALKAEVTKGVFKDVGLSEKHAALFAKVHEGDVTPEAVVAFATEYELPRREAAASETPDGEATPQETPIPEVIVDLQTGEATKPPTSGFAPVQTSGATPAGKIITDTAEAEQLFVTNPQEFIRLREAGRIKLATLPGSGDSKLPGAS